MWKESYCVGVALIDVQHKELFGMVDHLVKAVSEKTKWEDKKKDCREAVAFMKRYVVMHFSEEEKYQESIHYGEIEAHRKLHRKFTQDVLEYEKKLEETNYEVKVVKEFLGMLMAWLIYHVADADQKIPQIQEVHNPIKEKTLIQCYVRSVSDILNRMVGIEPSGLKGEILDKEKTFGDIIVSIGIVGDIQGNIEYGFSKEFAFEMMRLMTFMEMNEIDEMVCSAMSEISNIISANATIILKDQGYQCDITTPTLVFGDTIKGRNDLKAKILVNSPVGKLSLGTTFAI